METVIESREDALARVDAEINEARIIDFFRGIVEVPSQRYDEGKLARYLRTYLEGMGARVELLPFVQGETEMWNVVARYGKASGGKRIILCAHMDTGSGQYNGLVFQPERWTKDPFDGVVEDGFFYGLGAHNNKQGICCMVMALDAIVKSGVAIDGEILVAPVAAETACGVGAGHLVQAGTVGDFAIVLEGTGMDVVPVSVGKIRGQILVRGEHQHHSAHVNPVEMLRHVLGAFAPGYGDNRVRRYLKSNASDPELVGLPCAAIRAVQSDPLDLDTVAANFDVMVLPDQTPETVKADLTALMNDLSKEYEGFHADVEMHGWEPPLSDNFIWGAAGTPVDAAVVQAVAKHHHLVRGEAPVIGSGRRFGGASDAASFRRAGIPTVEYAPGSIGEGGELASWPAVDERVRVKDVIDCTRIVARACVELANAWSEDER